MEIEIFEVENGWGYSVGGVYQPYHPNKEGFVVMSKEEANTLASECRERLATAQVDHTRRPHDGA